MSNVSEALAKCWANSLTWPWKTNMCILSGSSSSVLNLEVEGSWAFMVADLRFACFEEGIWISPWLVIYCSWDQAWESLVKDFLQCSCLSVTEVKNIVGFAVCIVWSICVRKERREMELHLEKKLIKKLRQLFAEVMTKEASSLMPGLIAGNSMSRITNKDCN